MSTPLIRRPESDGASVQGLPAMAASPAEYGLPATVSDLGAQVSAVLALLTGVWVALSPWLITLQSAGNNATIVNLVSGLAVAGVGAAALISPRGFAGLDLTAGAIPLVPCPPPPTPR
jgi:SPW repeat